MSAATAPGLTASPAADGLRRQPLLLGLGCLPSAVLVGVVAGRSPLLALGLFALVAIIVVAFVAPTAHLTVLLIVTALVPYSLLNTYGLGLGSSRGSILLVSDLVLVAGLARAALAILHRPLDGRTTLLLAVCGGFLLVGVLQFLHGVQRGFGGSIAGSEFRSVYGYAALLIAVPILAEPGGRRRVAIGLGIVAVLAGLWGIVQWRVDIPYGASGDFGVREGVSLTTTGIGQVQGGAYAFLLAIPVAFALLISRSLGSRRAQVFVGAVLVLNTIGLLLTFARTFWVATIVSLGVVALRTPHIRRIRAIAWIAVATVLGIGAFAVVAPGQLNTASERILTLRNYQSDASLRFRAIESAPVRQQISERPLLGSGLGASIWWGRPADGVPPSIQTYTHNAYLRIVWKLGLIGAALLLGLLLAAMASALRPRVDGLDGALVTGGLGALVSVMITAVTGPTFTSFSAASLISVLVGLCLVRPGPVR